MTADLIKAIEEAEEGSRELSDRVLMACGWTMDIEDAVGTFGGLVVWSPPDNPSAAFCEGTQPRRPSPTENLQDAIDVIPADPANSGKPMLWSVAYDEDGVSGPRSYLGALGKGYHDPQFVYGHSDATPALALCAAVLRATPTTLGEE